jgi:hypothetical protein
LQGGFVCEIERNDDEEKEWNDEMMGVGTRHEEGRRWMAMLVG